MLLPLFGVCLISDFLMLLPPFSLPFTYARSRKHTHKRTRVHAGNVCGVRGEDHGGEFPSVPTLPVAYLGYTEEPMK